jgi:hypothetical protein
MLVYDKSFKIDGTVKSIFEDTWSIIRAHIGSMTLIWAVFYLPTNIFILLRSGDMVKHLNSGNSAVLPVMVLLSLLGTIPNIALVLLVRSGDCDDYNALVGSAFKKIPYYITTSFAMLFSMIPMILLSVIASLLLSLALESIGMAPEQQMYAIIPLIVLISLYAMLRFASAVPFYLMTGTRNLRAARYSSYLFRMNRKMILAAFSICTLLPMAVNFGMLYAIESEAVNVIFGFIIGYYLFLSTAFYAGFLNHIKEVEPELHDSDNKEQPIKEIEEKSEL